MKLFGIVSATATLSPTMFELVIDAEIDGVRAEYPYTFDATDPHGLAPHIGEHLKLNPIELLPYVSPPEPTPDAIAADARNLAIEFLSILRSKGVTKAQLVALWEQT